MFDVTREREKMIIVAKRVISYGEWGASERWRDGGREREGLSVFI